MKKLLISLFIIGLLLGCSSQNKAQQVAKRIEKITQNMHQAHSVQSQTVIEIKGDGSFLNEMTDAQETGVGALEFEKFKEGFSFGFNVDFVNKPFAMKIEGVMSEKDQAKPLEALGSIYIRQQGDKLLMYQQDKQIYTVKEYDVKDAHLDFKEAMDQEDVQKVLEFMKKYEDQLELKNQKVMVDDHQTEVMKVTMTKEMLMDYLPEHQQEMIKNQPIPPTLFEMYVYTDVKDGRLRQVEFDFSPLFPLLGLAQIKMETLKLVYKITAYDALKEIQFPKELPQ